jgi:ribonuclease PH
MARSKLRNDGRRADAPRPVKMTPNVLPHAEGSVLVEAGRTKVICTATVEDRVPPFLRSTGTGWITAEYGMLPRSAEERITRESVRGHPSGRTYEVQRLIGRSLRAVADLEGLGERTILIDCDVIQADGGTRTLAITGGFVALYAALRNLKKLGAIETMALADSVAAISVGIVDGRILLDLCYEEDSAADVDLNVVMTGGGSYVEIQGTAEAHPFSDADLEHMLSLARRGISRLVQLQYRTLGIKGVE